MRRNPRMRHLVAWILAVCLLLTCVPAVLAASQTQELGLQEVPVTAEGLTDAPAPQEPDTPGEEESLRVIIIFQDAALVERGYSTMGLASNQGAMAYRATLEKRQDAAMAKVSKALGQELELRYRFSIGVNGVATTLLASQIDTVEALDSVRAVYIENQYLPDTEEPDTSTAGTMVGSYSAWADGYTGAGSRIAIIDTGLDLDHPSFDEGCFLYGLELSAARFGKEVDDYNLLTDQEISQVLPKLHAAELYSGLTAQELYRSAKVPFAFNYVDEDLDVTHDNDTQGDHGTHVSGIATANTYVWSKDADGDLVAAQQENGVVGVAPDAQILTMKVFGKTGGAYDSDYMAAIEDAILLGCDTVNLSLGSSMPGHTYGDYDALFKSLVDSDTVVTISAGNKYSYAEFNNTGVKLQLTGDTVINTVGSPGAFGNAFTVASVDNAGLTGVMPVFSGVVTAYADTYSSYGMQSFASLDTSGDASGTAYEYVFLGDPVTGEHIYGAEEDFQNLDLTGKIVLISRGGGVSFFEKGNRAVEAGAVAAVVYNNAAGSINMNMTGYKYKNPAISIEKVYGDMILAASQQGEDGVWGGTMVIADKVQTVQNVPGGSAPSSFSSWGVPGNLDLKPEITAPGGNIWSTLTDGSYGSMSGTSMSSPSVTGMAAVAAQYVKENGLAEQEGLTVRALSQALLMSTSVPLLEEDGVEYSPRKQGSGLANVYQAVTTPAYLLTEDKNVTDGKVKACLGDDPERTGVYEFDFTVNNLSQETLSYRFRASVNTMDVEAIGGEDFMSDSSYALAPEVVFTTDAAERYVYDLNGDGQPDEKDAEVLLAVANRAVAPLSDGDAVKYDFDGDGEITSRDAKIYLRSLKGEKDLVDVRATAYVVEAGKAIGVHVKVTLSEADRAYFAENYENGCYVEGFVYAEDPEGQNAALSLPMLAYYGSWTEPSMFDKFITLEDSGDPDAYPYVGSSYTNALVMDNAYYLTGNPYAQEETFLADRTAVSTDSTITAAYATLIRNAGGSMYAEITNAETGEVYKTVNKGAQYGAYYNSNAGVWANTNIVTSLGWKVTDAGGNKLPEGTKVKVSVYAIPEYNWDRETQAVKGTLSHGAVWETTLTVDDTAPEILDASISRNLITGSARLSITAQDDRYVAAVLVTNARQTEILARQAAGSTQPGQAVDVDVDISGVTASEIVVLAVDYAGNTTGYLVNIGGGDGDGDDASAYIYANDLFDDAWLAFKPDDPGSAKAVAEGSVYAAEYIDGYVFTADSNRRFCVAPLEDLEDQIYIETLSLPSVTLDMAYNYADGKLYALCSGNYLYTIDPLMGDTTLVGVIPLPSGTLQTLACATDGTFYGATNSTYSSRLYTFTLGEEGFTVKAAPNPSGLSAAYIQSMAYDHNTGTLYHLNYGTNAAGTSYECRLVTYDLASGKATVLGSFGMNEMCGMFIPKKATTTFGPSTDVQEISLSEDAVSMLKGGTHTLEVSAKPWTVVNRACTWTTSDPTVATVEEGVITATGVGTCTVTAASVLNPEVTASCTVTVTALNQALTGLVWDENSEVWFSTFNTDTIPAYTKLTEKACSQQLMALAGGYAATYEENSDGSLISSLYTVSDTYDLTKIGTSEIGYTDLAWCPNVANGLLLATYGNYVAVVNTTTGGYDGAWDLSAVLGSGASAVGICYVSSQENNQYGYIDSCILLDSNGQLWLMGVAQSEGDFLRTTPQRLGSIGMTTGGKWYFSSIATNGKYVYCSLWTGDKTQLIALDLNSGATANLGSFGDEVWPVAGLEVDASDAADGALLVNAMDASLLTAPATLDTEDVPAGIAGNR
ncbi:MAG: S8 family serine peptidase [Clostridiales bacterium]|nr:S8 family serine peptidase [Clostridiales bacterium]